MVESGHRGQPQTSPSASSVSSTSTISVGKESPPEKIIGEEENNHSQAQVSIDAIMYKMTHESVYVLAFVDILLGPI